LHGALFTGAGTCHPSTHPHHATHPPNPRPPPQIDLPYVQRLALLDEACAGAGNRSRTKRWGRAGELRLSPDAEGVVVARRDAPLLVRDAAFKLKPGRRSTIDLLWDGQDWRDAAGVVALEVIDEACGSDPRPKGAIFELAPVYAAANGELEGWRVAGRRREKDRPNGRRAVDDAVQAAEEALDLKEVLGDWSAREHE